MLFVQYFVLALPLFAIVLAGFLLARWRGWPKSWTAALYKFVFSVALPVFLFRMMSGFSRLPPVDARLLVAFFGGCLVVFAIGRWVAARIFHLDGVGQSIFGLGGVFSNNVLLGLPLARVTLGEASIPSVALVLVFNALTLWTLVTISVEWARHGALSVAGFRKTAIGVGTNPIVVAVVLGTGFSLLGFELPWWLDIPTSWIAEIATPLSLAAVGMGLAAYGIRDEWRQSAAIAAIKLIVQPLVVWLLAVLLDIPALETKTVVLLASTAVGANVYLMSLQFNAMQGAVAGSLVISTAMAALTTPAFLAVLAWLS